MAKGDVTLKFDANTAAFVQAITVAREKLEAAAGSAQKFGEQTKKAGDHAESGMKKAGEAAKDLAIHVTGISSATQLAGKGTELLASSFENYFERMKAKAEALLGKILNINSALGASGQGTAAPAVRAQLAKLTTAGGQLVNPEEAAAAYGAISRAVGNKATPEDKLEATKIAIEGRAAQMDEETSHKLGINFAQMSRERRPGGAFENYSNEHLGDLAKNITENKPDGMSEKDMRFFARAKDKPQALKLLFAAAQSDESARALNSIQQAAEEKLDPQTMKNLGREMNLHPRERTEENQRKLRLFDLQQRGEDTMQAMLADPSLAPAADRLALKNLQEGAKRIPESRGLKAEIAAINAGADKETRLANEDREAKARAARVKEMGAAEALKKEGQKAISRAIFEEAHQYWSAIPGVNDAQAAIRSSGVGQALGFGKGLLSDREYNRVERESEKKLEDAKHDEHIDALKDIHDTLKEQTSIQRTSRNTALKNAVPGQD